LQSDGSPKHEPTGSPTKPATRTTLGHLAGRPLRADGCPIGILTIEHSILKLSEAMPESTTTKRAWRADSLEGPAVLTTTATDGPKVRTRATGVGRRGDGEGWSPWWAGVAGIRRLGAAAARAGRAALSPPFEHAEPFEEALHRFTAELEIPGSPEAIEAALLRLACRIAPRGRLELIRRTGQFAGHVGGRDALDMAAGPAPDRDGGPRAEGGFEDFPMRCGTARHGILRLHSPTAGDRPAPGGLMHRRLTMACILAACALEKARLKADWGCEDEVTEDDDPTTDPDATVRIPRGRPDVVRDATFLNAVLPFALGQSRRHGEPVSLLCVQVDRLGATRDLLGPEIADRLVHDLARTVGSLVRDSDIVARLDDDRIVALLVRSRGEDAMRVARTIGRTVAESGLGAPRMPGASVSIGVAEFPAIARDASSLIEAADEAMARARARGSRDPVLAEPRPTHRREGLGVRG
jgi:diguanylate cyclase (GGDEF)-like protein